MAHNDLFVLSDDDRERIQRVLRDAEQARPNPTLRYGPPEDDPPYPSIYVARTPSTGIPAMWGPAGTGTGSWQDLAAPGTGTTVEGENDRPGVADCVLFRLRTNDGRGRVYGRPRLESTGLSVTVHNPKYTAVAANILLVVKRDGEGQWWLDQTSAGGGTTTGDTSFLALLTHKEYQKDEFITYSWTRLNESDSLFPLLYSAATSPAPLTGRRGSNPAYHIDNRDMPVYPQPEVGTGSGNVQADELSVVRMWKGDGNFYLFGGEPWADIFRRTGLTDADGDQAYHRYYDQNTNSWRDGREVRLITAE